MRKRLRTLPLLVVLLAGFLAGCTTTLGSSTYDPRRACQSFGQIYWESDGTCRGGGA
jgi:hypothetical protein